MTGAPKPPNPEVNLAEAIRRRFAPLGGADDLDIPPREPGRDPPKFDVDQAPVAAIDHVKAQEQWDSLISQVESGAEFIITRGGKAVARLIPARFPSASETGEGAS